MSAQFTALLDANVLYDALLRDLLLEMSVADLFQARWSMPILNEMRAALESERPDIPAAALDRLIDAMNNKTRDCLVDLPGRLQETVIGLPDEGDRHVVAAAIQARAHAIVTWNLRDFPTEVLAEFRLEAIDPDSFLVAQWDLDAGRFMECVVRVRERLVRPATTAEDYIDALIRHRLVGTAARLRPMANFL